MTLNYRALLALSLPITLTGCPGDDTTQGPDDESSTASMADSTTVSTPDPSADSTSSSTSTSSGPNESSTTIDPSSTTDSGASTSTDGTTAGVIQVCGNNIIEGDEVCDLNQLNGETCVSQGAQGGLLGCSLTCDAYNLLGCFICGNEVLDLAEDCEGQVPEDVTCETLGFQAGTVTCGADCLYDTSDCSICGDGIQAGPEDCDGIDLDGQTCMSLGFDAGNLGCNIPLCAFDVSECAGGMYFQDFEAGVVPGEFSLGGTVDFEVDGTGAIAGAFSAHNGNITHNQTSSLLISGNFPIAGDISFLHSESTEGCCDHLEFYIDGIMQTQWSGTNPPTVSSFPVAAGTHDFEWRYDKDGSIDTGSDTVWVDDISMIPGVPI